jgi:N-acetyl-anhydromuramyl-L-alanine amidase AmpD
MSIAQNTHGYPSAIWHDGLPAFKFAVSTRNETNTSSYPIERIVIHQSESGSVESSLEDFMYVNPDPTKRVKKSAHYVIGKRDRNPNSTVMEVAQIVDEKDIAYHCGNLDYNSKTIGIEIIGYATKAAYTLEAFDAATNLCIYLCNKYNIPKNRVYIIGHNQVPDPDASQAISWGGDGRHYCPGGFYW